MIMVYCTGPKNISGEYWEHASISNSSDLIQFFYHCHPPSRYVFFSCKDVLAISGQHASCSLARTVQERKRQYFLPGIYERR